MKKLVLILALFLAILSAVHPAAVPLTTRIIDGTPVASGVLPWQVILKNDETDDLLCGGSVISPNWVLTAAHCTYGKDSIFLIFGTINLNSYSVSMTSTSLFINPSYDPTTLNNDVSLIELPSSLTYSSTIQPIQLVPLSDSDDSFIGTTAIIAGYGYTDDEDLEFSNILLSATVDIINNTICVDQFGSEIVIDSTMCAQGTNGTNKSICSGDSGGPLITLDSNGTYIQIGINSFVAQDACTEGYPSGYARLTSFLSYIQSVTNLDID